MVCCTALIISVPSKLCSLTKQIGRLFCSRKLLPPPPSFEIKKMFSTTQTSSLFAKQVIQDLESKFKAAKIPDAESSAKYLVGALFSETNMDRFSKKCQTLQLDENQVIKIQAWSECRLARMPLQYILGNWQFLRLSLKLRPPVFIPRPETEELVMLVVDHIEKNVASDSIKDLRIMDVCCGSGAIGLALADLIPGLSITCVDQSKAALKLTLENAVNLNLEENIKVCQAKITSDVGNLLPEIESSSLDVIVSNPPYVLRKDMRNLQPEICLYEDLRALDGGPEGLDIIKPLLMWASRVLKPGGLCFLEVDPCHPYLIPDILENTEELVNLVLLKVVKDFGAKERFLVIEKQMK